MLCSICRDASGHQQLLFATVSRKNIGRFGKLAGAGPPEPLAIVVVTTLDLIVWRLAG